jgi:branched-chain amino acid transport system substrate-binding protein
MATPNPLAFLRLGLSASLVLALAACGSEEPAAPPAPEPIKIGEVMPLSGTDANYGQSVHNGIALAAKQRNEAGGIDGKPIVISHLDDHGSPDEAAAGVNTLVSRDKVVAVLGEAGSTNTLAAAKAAQGAGIPLVAPTATAAEVTAVGDRIFRAGFLDTYQGYVAARYVREHLKLSKVAVLFDAGSSYSKGLKEAFAADIGTMGGTVVSEQTYAAGDASFATQLQAIKDSGAEAVFLPGLFGDVGKIAVEARGLGITAAFVGGDGWGSPQLAQVAGEAIEGSSFTTHYIHDDPRPEVKAFVDAYQAAYGNVPDAQAALGYDAARMLFDAIDRADSTESAAITAALAGTKGFKGVTGQIDIDAQRNARKAAVVVQMKGGKPTYVIDILPSEVPAAPADAAAPAAAEGGTAAPAEAAPAGQ